MVWAYVMENGNGVEKHDNTPVFQLIQKMELPDDQLVFDQDNNRTEFCKLLESLQTGDKLIIRSVADLADDLMDLICVFQKLTDKEISLCSCEEPFLSGEDYLGSITEFTRLYVLFQKKKQQAGYRKACAEGRVGRPPTKSKDIEQAIELYKSDACTISQITALTGVSKTTLYRVLKEQKVGSQEG